MPPMSHAFRAVIDLRRPRAEPALAAASSGGGAGIKLSSDNSMSTSPAAKLWPSRQTLSAVSRITSSTPAVAKCVTTDSIGFGPRTNAVSGRSMMKKTDSAIRDCRPRSLPRATINATTVFRIAKT